MESGVVSDAESEEESGVKIGVDSGVRAECQGQKSGVSCGAKSGVESGGEWLGKWIGDGGWNCGQESRAWIAESGVPVYSSAKTCLSLCWPRLAPEVALEHALVVQLREIAAT